MLRVGAFLVGSHALVVQLGNLHIHGIQLTNDENTRSNAFLGIPFAQPPVGELRWADPQPVVLPQTTQHLQAKILPPACAQSVHPGLKWVYETTQIGVRDYASSSISGLDHHNSSSEDCLYLNIFAPDNGSTKRPVMVWIHGGAFMGGSAAGYDGRSLATSQDVIVVAIQYRLGVFGFLSTEDSAAKGNWGLKDQTMALRWVQEHIGQFGGDASRVTIFGESAGSVSCGMHTISPYSSGLFHNAILQSGTEQMAMLYSQNPARMAKTLATQLKCNPDESSSSMLACLRSKSPQAIESAILEHSLAAQEQAKKGDTGEKAVGLAFFPSIDGEFFPEHPLTTKFANECNLMVGYNSDEMGFLLGGFFGLLQPITAEQLEGRLGFVAQSLARGDAEYVPKFLEVLKQVYRASQDPDTNSRTAQQAMADLTFVANAFAKATTHSARGHAVYMYELMSGIEFMQDHSLVDPVLVNVSELPPKPSSVGADHADDIPFVFGFPFNPNYAKQGYRTTQRERLLSGVMMGFWGQFARSGGVLGWPRFEAAGMPVMSFTRDGSRVSLNPHPEVSALWLEQIPKLVAQMTAKGATRQDL